MEEQPHATDTENTQQDTTQPMTDLSQPIAWQAPEGVQAHRTTGWYVAVGFVVLALMALAIFVFNSWTFAILLPIMAVALVLLRSKPSVMVNYAISPKGVYVADRLYDFSEFRAFGLGQDGDQHSAILLPVKRFSPALTIYFSEAEGQDIVDMLGARLPMQEIAPDALEKLIRIIRL